MIINTVFEQNYKKLMTLIPELWSLRTGRALKSRVEGYMDLNLDILKKQEDKITLALSHYYMHPSGDMIADPDMEIRVCRRNGWAEALTYQDMWGYKEAYLDKNRYNPKLKNYLNSFLTHWLKNCLAQGHKLKRNKSKT